MSGCDGLPVDTFEAVTGPDDASDLGDLPEGGAGARPNTPLDAGGTIRITDAQTVEEPGSAEAGAQSCEGKRAFGLCWYLGEAGASCLSTCRTRGGYDPRTADHVGTDRQGGSLEACASLLELLGFRGSVFTGIRPDDVGFGCHVWDYDGWWLEITPDMTPRASDEHARVVCACMR